MESKEEWIELKKVCPSFYNYYKKHKTEESEFPVTHCQFFSLFAKYLNANYFRLSNATKEKTFNWVESKLQQENKTRNQALYLCFLELLLESKHVNHWKVFVGRQIEVYFNQWDLENQANY